MLDKIKEALKELEIRAELERLEPYGSGHINRTFKGCWRFNDGSKRLLIHQQINTYVFPDVELLMSNMEFLLGHLADLSHRNETELKFPSLLRTRRGKSYVTVADQGFVRTLDFIPDSLSFDECLDLDMAAEMGRALAELHRLLSPLQVSLSKVILPNFHDLSYRIKNLNEAVLRDTKGRAAGVAQEIRFIQERSWIARDITEALVEGSIPLRIAHNDLKVNNFLFSTKTSQAISIVDYDICMPGSFVYDVGDLVRSASIKCAEDETELLKVKVNKETSQTIFKAYLQKASQFLTRRERELIPISAVYMALSLGSRFLTDYLNGDLYFKTSREGQNLDRARVQLAIVAQMESQTN